MDAMSDGGRFTDSEIAERMGPHATAAEGAAMRRILIARTGEDVETAMNNMDDREFFRLIPLAVADAYEIRPDGLYDGLDGRTYRRRSDRIYTTADR